MKLAGFVGALLVAGCQPESRVTPADASPPATAKKAPFVVAMVIDQLGAWEAAERFAELPKTGGFARLLREGTYARDMRYAHATTDTAPGHSSLFTGSPPFRSGITANERIDERTRERRPTVNDPTAHQVTAAGPEGAISASLTCLKVETVSDVLRLTHPKATIIALSLKDRGTIFGAGRHPSAALWYDPKDDEFVTSSAFTAVFPAWAAPVSHDWVMHLRDAPWTPLDATWDGVHAKQPDAQPGESDIFGTTTFPHSFQVSQKPTTAFRASPAGDAAVLRLAALAVDQRDPAEPMLLTVSVSGLDYVGHFFGVDSWEWWDELSRIDQALGAFFTTLDQKVGVDGWSLVLAGDHGASTLPEAPAAARPWCVPGAPPDPWQRPCRTTGRLIPTPLGEDLKKVAEKALGPGDYILGVSSPYVFYTRAALDLPTDKRKKLDEAIQAALLANPEVDRVYFPHAGRCPPESDESIDALVCRSLPPDNLDGIYIVAKPGSFFDTEYDPGKGDSHGSANLFDRSVPLFVRAPGRAAAGEVMAEPIGFGTYVQTVAALLGVRPPPGAFEGRVVIR